MLAQAGGKVIIADVQADKGEALARELGANTRFDKCDVTSEADGQAVVAAATALGTLRGLINCAGVAIGEKTVGKEGPHALASFQRVIGINLIGTFNVIRLAATAMPARARPPSGERGVMVNTASVAAFDGQIGQAAYAASKGGVVGMTLPIARDLSPQRHPLRDHRARHLRDADAARHAARTCRSRSASSPFPRGSASRPSTPTWSPPIIENGCSTARRSASTARSACNRSHVSVRRARGGASPRSETDASSPRSRGSQLS